MAHFDARTPAERRLSGPGPLVLICAPIFVFLLLPSLIIVPMALTRGQMIQFPPEWISMHAFVDYLRDPQWIASTLLSFKVAVCAVAIGCIVGSAAAVALHNRRFPGSGAVAGVIMAPIVVPIVVLALGDYTLFARFGLIGNWTAIVLAHALLATPFVFISVQTSLTAELDPALVRSARSLGAGRLAVLAHVYWPAIRPGMLAGAVLGFAISFDEVVIAFFLQGAEAVTLPVRMYSAIQYELTPVIAASASLFLLMAVLALALQGRLSRGQARQ